MSKLVTKPALADTWASYDYEVVGDAKGDQLTLSRVGDAAALLAERPTNGDVLSGDWAGYLVVSTKLTGRPGKMAKLRIVARKDLPEPSPGEGRVIRVKLRWMQETKPLTSDVYGNGGTSTNVSLLTAWKHEDNPVLREAFKAEVPVSFGDPENPEWKKEIVELDAETKKLAERLLAGQDGYAVWYPVVTVVTQRERDAPVIEDLNIFTASELAALCDRTWIPRQINGKDIQYLRAAPDMEDDDVGTLQTVTYLGAIPPGGKLGAAWGDANAFDSLYYPTVAPPPPEARKQEEPGTP